MSLSGAFLGGAVLACVASSASAHSFVACTDYRGDVNYFEQDKCLAWPRGYQPEPQEKGYQIAEPESRAWGNGGCDRPMSVPDWRGSYTADFPHAVYEPGKVYCLAWPMKNHATASAACDHPHAKSDAGTDESLTLMVSSVDPARDPTQEEFFLRNINELAGLATGCSHKWSERNAMEANELADKCQLGLERHQDGQLDCKGFQRAPKFCENTGAAMGTGCFKVPANMAAGHYVAQWHWDASFEGRGHFAYTTCFDFAVVPAGSDLARPGTPGTVGMADSSRLPCQNNVLNFEGSQPQPVPPSSSRVPSNTAAPGDPEDSAPAETAAPAPAAPCSAPWEVCAGPDRTGPTCCTEGHECTPWNEHWSQCLPVTHATTQTPATTAAPPVPPSSSRAPAETAAPAPAASCSAPWEVCAGPDWTGPTCCTEGHECAPWNEHWSQCLPVTHASTRPPATTAAPRGSGEDAPAPDPEHDTAPAGTAAPTPAPAGPCAAPWDICEGPFWKAPLCCTAGHVCTPWNEHWSQCLPVAEERAPALLSSKVRSSRARPRAAERRFLAPEQALMQLGAALRSEGRVAEALAEL